MNNTQKSSPALEQLESLAVKQYRQDLRRSHALPELLSKRWLILRDNFTWNEEKVKKLLWVNDKLTLCLQKAKSEAEKMEEMLKGKMGKDKSFVDDFEIDISLQPFILEADKDGYMQEPENNIYAVLNGVCEGLKISLSELQRKDNLFLSTQLNWADLLPEFTAFVGGTHTIGYALHVLYEHCYWSMQDILKISEFWAEVHIKLTHFSEKLYAGFVHTDHADLIKVKSGYKGINR